MSTKLDKWSHVPYITVTLSHERTLAMKMYTPESLDIEVKSRLEKPAQGTVLYDLAGTIGRMLDGSLKSNVPVSDEHRSKALDTFMEFATVYELTREQMPQTPVMLCAAELALVQEALTIAALAVKVMRSPIGGRREAIAAKMLEKTIRDLEDDTMLLDQPSTAYLGSYVHLAGRKLYTETMADGRMTSVKELEKHVRDELEKLGDD